MIQEPNIQWMSIKINNRKHLFKAKLDMRALLIVGMVCVSVAIIGSVARAAPSTIFEQLMVPLLLDGERVSLAVRIYRPEGAGPFPTLIHHHGSTGRGDSPERFAWYWPPVGVIEYFTRRGWCVVVPSRRGRGGSEGMYNEGFTPLRDRYSAKPRYSLPGADRALTDINAVTDVILEWQFVDPERIVVSGISRGGILSVAHAGQRPELYRGVINFVGGWVGGRSTKHRYINQKLFKRGVPFGEEILWVYARGDPFYSLAKTRKYFAKFVKAGGKGVFFDEFPDGIGHGAASFPEYWGPAVEAYLARQGIDLQEVPNAIPQPDPTRSPVAFIGKWKGAYDIPVSVNIWNVTSGRVNGEYRYRNLYLTELHQSLIENGVLQHVWESGESIEFFLDSEDVMIVTYASEERDGRRSRNRYFLKRDPD